MADTGPGVSLMGMHGTSPQIQTFGKDVVSPRTPRSKDPVLDNVTGLSLDFFKPRSTDISIKGCKQVHLAILKTYRQLIKDLDELVNESVKGMVSEDDLKEIINSLKKTFDAAHEKKEQMDGGGGERIKQAIKSFYLFTRMARGCITVNAIRILVFKLLTIFFNTAYNYALVHFAAVGTETLGGWAVAAAGVSPIGAALGPYLAPVFGCAIVLYGLNKILRIIRMTTQLTDGDVEKVAREVKTEILRRNMQDMIEKARVEERKQMKEDYVAIKLVTAKEIVVQNLMNGEIVIPDTDELTEITNEQIPELPFIKRVYSEYMNALDKLGGLPEDAVLAILNYLKARAAGEGAGGPAYENLMNELKLATIILSLSGADLGNSLATHTGFTILAGAGNLAQTIATCAGVAAVSRVIGRRIIEILTSAKALTGAAVNNAGVPLKVAKAFVYFLKEDREAVNKARQEGQEQFNQELVESINGAAAMVLAEYTDSGSAPPRVVELGEMNNAVEAAQTALLAAEEPSGTDEAAALVMEASDPAEQALLADMEASDPAEQALLADMVGGKYKSRKKSTKRKKSKRRKSTRRNSRKTTVRRKSRRLSRKSKRLSRKLKK